MIQKKTKSDYENDHRENILKYNKMVGMPKKYMRSIKSKSHSWFDISTKKIDRVILEKNRNIPPRQQLIKCKKIILLLSEYQKKIILRWMNASVKMYNETIKLFNNYRYNKIPLSGKNISFRNIRDTTLRDKVSKISSVFNTPTKVISDSIKLACSNLKTCITNLKNKRIKKFRLRYLKLMKPTKIISIQSEAFSKVDNTIFKRYNLGKINSGSFKLSKIKKTCTLHYNTRTERFTLLVPMEEFSVPKGAKRQTISIDPGIRTFLTGISDNHILELGQNMKDKLSMTGNKLDKLNKSSATAKQKKKKRIKIHKKLEYIVEDLHWKSINYLITKYRTIIIGKLSTKSICSKKNGLSNDTKFIAQYMNFYKFLTRLEYKCKQSCTNLYIINESYTTILCSNCGTKNEKLRGSKNFNCDDCKLNMDRDINSARSIFIKWKGMK